MKPFLCDVIFKHRPWAEELIGAGARYLKARGVRSVTQVEDNFLYHNSREYFIRALNLPEEWLPLIGTPQFEANFEEALHSDKQIELMHQTLLFEYYALLNFELSDRKVFYFDGKLVDRLLVTVADAPSDLLRLPFPSCFFVLDYPPLLELYEVMTKAEAWGPETPLSVSVTESERPDGRHLSFFVSRVNHRTLAHSTIVMRSWLMGGGRTVEEALETEWPPDADIKDDDTRFYRSELLVFFRFLANSILYLSSRSADLVFRESPLIAELEKLRALSKRSRKFAKGRAASRRSQDSRLNYTHVGGTIPVTPFRPFLHNGDIQELRRILVTRSLVRGHWRLQPYGPASSLRMLIFIEPYWRGPDFSEQINKPYEVKI